MQPLGDNMKRAGLLAIIALLAAGEARAQYVVSVTRIEYIPVFKSLPVLCDRAMGAQAEYSWARKTWESQDGSVGDSENSYICTVDAALAGYVPAQTLLGRMYSHVRRGLFDVDTPPQYGGAEEALYWFEKAADGADGRGAYEAGLMYEMGVGALQDDDKARRLYQRAADQHDGRAAKALKQLDNREDRIAKFQAKFQDKADSGNPLAMRRVGEGYLNGDPFRASMDQAYTWLFKAAKGGDSSAQAEIGIMYARGVGVARDENQAVNWLLKASSAGLHSSDGEFWNLYNSGNLDAAHKTAIEKASARGALVSVFGPFDISPRPPEQAVLPTYDIATLEKGAANGERLSIFNLGVVYLSGAGVPADIAKARALFERIADQDSDAGMNLGDTYYAGQPEAPDYAQAVKWYAAAAAMGDPIGAKNAENIYLNGGNGVAPDPIRAYAFAILERQLGAHDGLAQEQKLGARLSHEDKARAVAWLNRILLEHHRT